MMDRSDKPATWHHHYDLACADCGLIVYPGRSTCILWAGRHACTLPLVMRCKACMEASEPEFPPVTSPSEADLIIRDHWGYREGGRW